MKYNFTKEIDIQSAKTRLDFLIEKKSKNVEITEKRTEPQNSYLHLILGWFALEYGETLDFVKVNFFKKLCNKDIFITYKDDKFLKKVEIIRSSADITTGEMSIAIDRFRNWSSKEAGIYLPEANEEQNLKSIQEVLNRQRRYL